MGNTKEDPATTSHDDNAQDSTETYSRGGGALRAHGDEYHLLLVMTIMIHAYMKNIDFEMAIEYKPAGKFDDIYFKFKNEHGEWKYTYFQIKHTEKKEIKLLETGIIPTTPPPQKKGTKKVIKSKYDIFEFLKSYIELKKSRPEPCSCFLYINQKWSVEGIPSYFSLKEVNAEDIDKFLLNIMNKKLFMCTETSWYTKYKNEISVDDVNYFVQSFFIAQGQPSLDDMKDDLKLLISELANKNLTLRDMMFDNLFGQMQKWFNSRKGTFKNKGFVQSFINSFVNNTKFFYRHHVRSPNKHFVGRSEQLQSITLTTEKLKDTGEYIDVAVVGMSGFGKTQLILKYLHDKENEFTHIFWINAESDTTIFHAFLQIAKKFDVSYNSMSSKEEDLLHDIYNCFNKQQKVAFVFDNANDIDDLMKYLPSNSQNYIKIFITSNNIDWPAQVTIKMETFHENESIELATKILGKDVFERDTLINLAGKLGHFPLAIHLACSYIVRMTSAEDCENPHECVSQFLEDYMKEPTFFQNLNPSFKDYNSYKQSLFKIWLIQKQRLLKSHGEQGEVGVKVMKLLSLCESDNIPQSILEQGFDTIKEQISSDLSTLETYSLIDIKEGKIFIHNLLQDIIKQEMKQNDETNEFLEIALQSFNKLKTPDADDECFFHSDILNHALKIWNTLIEINITEMILKYACFPQIIMASLNMVFLFRQAIEYCDKMNPVLKLHFNEKSDVIVKTSYFRAQAMNLGGEFTKALEELEILKEKLTKKNEADTSSEVAIHPFLWAVLLETAYSLTHIGKHKEAVEIYDQVLIERMNQLGDNHRQILLCRNNRINVLQDLGKYEEALQEYDTLLAVETEILGENHTGTLCTQSNIASVLEHLGRYEEALNIYKKLIEVEKEKLGPKHPNTLTTMNNYALVLSLMGQYDEALDIYNTILQITCEIFGEEHPKTLLTLVNKAITLDGKGLCQESITIYDKVIEIRQETLGYEHQETLTAMNNRALALQKLGRFEESLSELDYVITAEEKSLGPDHPLTIKSLSNKAMLLTNMGRFIEALNLYDTIIENDKTLGIDHPETLTLLNNKASLLDNMGRYEEALQMFVEIYNVRKDKLGHDHPATLVSMSHKALTLQRMGKYNEALQEYDTLLELQHQKLGKTHPNVTATLANKAILLRLMGKYEEALTAYDILLIIRKEQLGVDHPSTLAAMNNKAIVLQNMKQFNEALEIYNEIIPLQHKKLGSDHPSSLCTLHNRASILQQLGRLEEALVVIENILQNETCKLGAEHPSTLSTMYGKAYVLQSMENFEESLELYNHVLSIQKVKLGDEHPSVLSTMHNKATLLYSMGDYIEARQLFEQVLEKKTRVLGVQHPSTLKTLKYLEP